MDVEAQVQRKSNYCEEQGNYAIYNGHDWRCFPGGTLRCAAFVIPGRKRFRTRSFSSGFGARARWVGWLFDTWGWIAGYAFGCEWEGVGGLVEETMGGREGGGG